jgi:hypothetical protein
MRTNRARTGETDAPSYRGNAIAVGVLFILCSAAAILSMVPLGAPVSAPVEMAKLAANSDRVVWTALIEFVWAITGAGIAIGLYPVLRKSSPGLALGSVIGRVFENVFVLVGTLGLLTVLAVSQQAASSAVPASFQAIADALLGMRTWATGFVAIIPFAIGTILYSYVLYRSRLVPRWLAGWGLVAGVLSLVATLYAGFTQDFGFTTVNNVLSAPIGLQEMALAVWLIAKGFSKPALARVESRVELTEARAA